MRILQGLSASSVLVIGNAMIRDLFEGPLLIKAMSRAMLFQAASWFLGPFGAALLLNFTDWRGVARVFAAVTAILLFLAIRILPETLHFDDRNGDIFKGMIGRFRAVLRDREYAGLVGIGMLFQLSIYTYLTVIPLIYQNGFGVAATTVGVFIGLNSVASYIGVQLSSKIAQYIHPKWVLTGVIVLAMAFAAGMVLTVSGTPPLWLAAGLVLLFVFTFGSSVTPNFSLALAPHGHEAGTAAALMGVASYLVCSAAGPFFTTLDNTNLGQVGATIFTFMALALLLSFAVVKPRAWRAN
jgi:DHA1 family bicyclomycin/chloramphenicol resistance-like MFS transporter